MIKIKICGITNLEDAQLAVESGADSIGFVFTKSPRRISPLDAGLIIKEIPLSVDTVGVFVDETLQELDEIIRISHINTIQLHGLESPEYCSNFKSKVKVIKTFRVKDKEFLQKMSAYKTDNFLLDTYISGQPGGTGKVFDWNLAATAARKYPNIILAGGLNPDNICEALNSVKPYGVDVSTGIEACPCKKDPVLLKEFIARVRSCP
ncbi:MAG: phosphoribosylanthranilate isomerase [Candidatus Omnitrophica bacterium]|nr:phosphoribosylanthranilate isomerase [Candidatus Omnitrophota bacterium]MCK4422789.1 phosphoribosylanthranilate isomerase [Candidatus Omnitrophota bacterium]